jgi:hypothetical protein
MRRNQRAVFIALGGALLAFAVLSVVDLTTTRWLFIHGTYYLLMATVLCWAGTYLHAALDLRWGSAAAWAKENWPGLVIAFGVTVSVGLAVEPSLRVLSDEANLVGVSKNLFASKTATFTVSGKYYYGSYFDVDVAIDRRPTLFPFLVSLLHALVGYSYRNAFHFNLLLLVPFILVAYRLARSLGGATFGVVAALFVAAHPILLISVRSGGFDFLAAFFGLLVVKSLFDYGNEQSPSRAAVLWLNLCLFAETRYESALFVLPVVLWLLLFKLVKWSTLRPYAFVYALTPLYLLPRIWQSLLKGNVPEQEPGVVTFGVENFLGNAQEYFQPLSSPFKAHPAHAALLIALGCVGCLGWVVWFWRRVRAGEWTSPKPRFAIFLAGWMVLQVVVVFAYVWGRAQYPSAARLVIPIDVFFSFAAASVLTCALKRWRPFVPVLFATAVVAFHLPVASQGRMLNRLTQTRESAVTWSFFERLNDPRILIVTDRPNHFTIMNYGAMDFETARQDAFLFTALDRHLFSAIYVIQQVALSTNQPLPRYELWPDRELHKVLEFQNDADVLVRISRLVPEKANMP